MVDKLFDRDVLWENIDGTGLDTNLVKGILGCLYTVISNGVRYGLDAATLEHELVMLGVNEEVSSRLAALLTTHGADLKRRLVALNPARPGLAAATCTVLPNSSALLSLTLSDGADRTIAVHPSTLSHLHHELLAAQSKMSS